MVDAQRCSIGRWYTPSVVAFLLLGRSEPDVDAVPVFRATTSRSYLMHKIFVKLPNAIDRQTDR
jgi:hypothetical protein